MVNRCASTLITAIVCLSVSTTGVWGAVGLVDIGVLPTVQGGTPQSKIYAVSPDGTYAVGSSMGQDALGASAMSQAIIWSSGSGLVQIPNPNGQANHAHGVMYDNSGNLVVAGYDFSVAAGAYRMAAYITSPANLTGGAWNVHSQNNTIVGEYNAARTQTQVAPGAPVQLIAGRRGSGNRGIAAIVGTTSFTDYRTTDNIPPGTIVVMNSPAAVPRNAGSNLPVGAGYDNGYDTAAGRRRALFMPNGNLTSQTVIPGGSTYQSEAYGITPGATQTSGVVVGYDQDATANHYPHAFFWNVGGASMTFLNELSGDVASAAIDVRLLGGNRIIGGYSSDGTTEKAVLWDSTGTWDNSGQPMLLSALLASAGVDVSGWSSLSRVTTMSDNGMTVAGWGIWAADGTTRGFVATIPEPATLTLLIAALPLLRRARRRV